MKLKFRSAAAKFGEAGHQDQSRVRVNRPAKANFFDAAEWPLRELEEAYGIVGLPLIETRANFKGPCRLHDTLELETRITSFQRKTLEMTHTLTNAGKVAVEATDVRFWGVRHPDGSGRLKAEEIPADVIEFFGGD